MLKNFTIIKNRQFLKKYFTTKLSLPLKTDLYTFDIIKTKKDSEAFIDSVCDIFSRNEMSMTGAGCSKADLHTVFDHMGEYLLKNHTAIAAKDNKTQEIVSGTLGMDYCYKYPESALQKLSPKARDLLTVLGYYKKKNEENKEVIPKLNEYFYIFAGITKEAYLNQKLYTTLNTLIQDLAKSKGFKYMIRESGAPEILTILKKEGYRVILKENIEKVNYGEGIKVKVPEHLSKKGENGIPYWVELKREL